MVGVRHQPSVQYLSCGLGMLSAWLSKIIHCGLLMRHIFTVPGREQVRSDVWVHRQREIWDTHFGFPQDMKESWQRLCRVRLAPLIKRRIPNAVQLNLQSGGIDNSAMVDEQRELEKLCGNFLRHRVPTNRKALSVT